MRRFLLPLALFALTGTLVAQTPRTGLPLAQQNLWQSKVSWASSTDDGDVLRMKGVKFEFNNGVTVTADEGVAQKGHSTVQLSGNVQMTVK